MSKKSIVNCLYCGHQEKVDYWSVKYLDVITCSKCKGKQVKLIELGDVFGYEYEERKRDKK